MGAALLAALAVSFGTPSPVGASSTEEAPERIDYILASRGAWLVSVEFSGAERGPKRTQAFETYDGHATPRGMVGGAGPDAQLTLVYELPALTTFDRLAVPEVAEVPSGYVTFFREVEVHGSAASATDGYELLAKETLETHPKRGMVTELDLLTRKPVRFVKLVLRGGIKDEAEKMDYQWSELIGNGTQETVPLEEGFTGIWDTQLPDIERSAGLIELKQDGVAVTGCYVSATINGTVSGNILRARGVSKSGTPSQYVLLLDSEGALRGTANSNNGPFGLFGGPPAPEGSVTECSDIPQPELGCGSTIYVQFEFDSADLRLESAPILADLFEGLNGSPDVSISIEGHTSSEGSDAYNQSLSERRAQSVVDDLIRRGIEASRISAVGRGEHSPIASNKDESGRALNRRVEVVCE